MLKPSFENVKDRFLDVKFGFGIRIVNFKFFGIRSMVSTSLIVVKQKSVMAFKENYSRNMKLLPHCIQKPSLFLRMGCFCTNIYM